MSVKKSSFKKLLKTLSILVVIFFMFIIILWFALPSILKNYIEENDKEWINREITIGKIGVNPMKLKANIYNCSIKESSGKAIFLSFDKLTVNFDLWDLLKKKISTDNVTLTNLDVTIIQNGNQFNFSDLFKNNSSSTSKDNDQFDFSIRNINLVNAKLQYVDEQIDSKVILDSITIRDKGFSNLDSIFDANVAIHQKEGGWIKGDCSYNLRTDDYVINSDVTQWQISPFKCYVTSAIRLSEFSGLLNSNLHLVGNTSSDYIKTNGLITLKDFNLMDPESKPLVSVGELLVDIKQINSNESVYDFKDIIIKDSKVNFEYLPKGDNFSKLLVNSHITNTNNVSSDAYVSPFEMLSVYIYDMTKEYIFKSYTAENIELSNFNLKFYDYTLEDPFHMDLEHLNIVAKNIKPNNQYANFNVNGKINATGIIKGNVSVSRSGVQNMNVDLNIDGLFLNRFSPYGRYYTAHRFLEGISSFKNKSIIKDSYLTSTNTFSVENIQVSKKDKTDSGYSLPMRLGVALMKDSKGNINLDIPIEGPVNDPEYKFGKVIWQVVKNIFLKIVSSPVKALATTFKTDVNDLDNVYFDNGQSGLSSKQKKPLDKIVKVLEKKKEFNIEFLHLYNVDYEMDLIALKTAKISYLKQSDSILDSSIPIGKHAFDLSSSDENFLLYLKNNVSNYDETISIPENARRFIGTEVVKQKLVEVAKKQKLLIKDYLIKEKGINESRLKVTDGSNTEEAINQSLPKFKVKFDIAH